MERLLTNILKTSIGETIVVTYGVIVELGTRHEVNCGDSPHRDLRNSFHVV